MYLASHRISDLRAKGLCLKIICKKVLDKIHYSICSPVYVCLYRLASLIQCADTATVVNSKCTLICS